MQKLDKELTAAELKAAKFHEDDDTRMEPFELRELAESPWLTEQCNHHTNGQCMTRRCLLRGGCRPLEGKPLDPDCATCEAKEISEALVAAAEEIERLRSVADEAQTE